MLTLVIVALCAAGVGALSLVILVLALCHLSNSPVLGHAEPIANTRRRFGSAATYYRVPVVAYGVRRYLVLTPKELVVATQRAEANPEDCPFSEVNRALWPVLRLSL